MKNLSLCQYLIPGYDHILVSEKSLDEPRRIVKLSPTDLPGPNNSTIDIENIPKLYTAHWVQDEMAVKALRHQGLHTTKYII